MIKRILTAMFVVMLFMGITANADNRFYIEDFSISVGETTEVGIILENTVDFAAFQADIYLPDGLEFVDLRTTAEINKNKDAYYFTLSDRKDDHSLSSSSPDSSDPQHRRMLASSLNNYTFYSATDAGTAVLVNFKVYANENFKGAAVITLSDIIFSTADATKYTLTDTSATVSLPKTMVESVTLNVSTLNLAPTETATLSATVLPENASNKTLKWESSNAGVATVSSSGLVTAVSEGSATITATATDGSGYKATCEVTVKEIVNIFILKISR